MKKLAYSAVVIAVLLILGGYVAHIYNVKKPNTDVVKNAPGVLLPSSGDSKEDVLKNEDATVTLIAVGDIMLDRTVEQKIIANKDINFPFLKIRDYLKTADIVFANLENPITSDDPEVYQTSMVFNAKPGMERALRDAGITIVSLSNNHTMNYGPKGILNTFTYLDSVGLEHFGAGKNAVEAAAPVILSRSGIKFAFLGYTDNDVVPSDYQATNTRPGNNFMNIEAMQSAVKNVRPEADIVIVSMHSGDEYEPASDRQIRFAHAAIDAGADMVIGTHPHVLQKIEEYKGKYIMYSLGNFVFDQMWSIPTTQSVIAKFTFDKKGVVQGEFTPIRIKNYSQPEIVTDQVEIDNILKQLEFPLNNVKYLK